MTNTLEKDSYEGELVILESEVKAALEYWEVVNLQE